MSTETLPEIRINTKVPDDLLLALSRVRGKYSPIEHVFHCINMGDGHWIGVVGDGDNGSYEHFVFANGQLTISDKGYGWTLSALKVVLNQEVD